MTRMVTSTAPTAETRTFNYYLRVPRGQQRQAVQRNLRVVVEGTLDRLVKGTPSHWLTPGTEGRR